MSEGGSYFICPHCGHDKCAVTNTRWADNAQFRSRKCLGCRKTFPTYEMCAKDIVRRAELHRVVARVNSALRNAQDAVAGIFNVEAQ